MKTRAVREEPAKREALGGFMWLELRRDGQADDLI